MEPELTIGALSERTGVAASALRFYEAEGMIHSRRSSGGQRRYKRETIRRVSFIKVAQEVGLSLIEIRSALGLAPPEPHPEREGLGTASDVLAAADRRPDPPARAAA